MEKALKETGNRERHTRDGRGRAGTKIVAFSPRTCIASRTSSAERRLTERGLKHIARFVFFFSLLPLYLEEEEIEETAPAWIERDLNTNEDGKDIGAHHRRVGREKEVSFTTFGEEVGPSHSKIGLSSAEKFGCVLGEWLVAGIFIKRNRDDDEDGNWRVKGRLMAATAIATEIFAHRREVVFND